MTPIAKNPILSELYEILARILADHPHDLREHLDEELRHLKTQGHPIAEIPQRRILAKERAVSPVVGRD